MKKLAIMRGIPGSGKSTYAGNVLKDFRVISADHYFIVDGEYRFNPAKLSEAHKSCMLKFLEATERGENVVVDNTNIGVEELAPYVAVGEAREYEVSIFEFDVDPVIAAKRNLHKVPEEKIMQMHKRMHSTFLPKRWRVYHIGQ